MRASAAVFSTAFVGASGMAFPCSQKPPSPPQFPLLSVRHPVIKVVSSSTAPVGKTKELRGIMKPRRVTPEMADLVGATEISRTQVLKLIWAYIKENNLQDPDNKKIIVCDEKLKRIFGGKDRVGFLEIAGLISPHFLK